MQNGILREQQKRFAKTLKVEDRMECYPDQHAYITLKDHKENFRNNTKTD